MKGTHQQAKNSDEDYKGEGPRLDLLVVDADSITCQKVTGLLEIELVACSPQTNDYQTFILRCVYKKSKIISIHIENGWGTDRAYLWDGVFCQIGNKVRYQSNTEDQWLRVKNMTLNGSDFGNCCEPYTEDH